MARKTRRDKGKRQLSERDLWVLPWIASMYAIRFDQLQKLLSRQPGQRNKTKTGPQGITDSAVDQVIDRWLEDPPLVVYDRSFRQTPGWIWLTRHGESEFMLPYARHHIRKGTLSHKYWINHVRLDYEQRHPDVTWKSERQIRAEQPRRERGTRVLHIPDGEIWKAGERLYAIEVELSPKSEDEIDEDLQDLFASGYRAIWYFVSQADDVAKQAKRVVEKAHARLSEDQQANMQIIDLAEVGKRAAAQADQAKTDQPT